MENQNVTMERHFSTPERLPKIIGHRGCRAPGVFENSARAVARALAEGADIIEIDVVRTRDGQFVAFHWPDPHTLSLPPWKYRFSELPPCNRISEILKTICNGADVYLDVKHALDRSEFLELATTVESIHHRQVIVGSFYRTVLEQCKAHRPDWIVNFDCLPIRRFVKAAQAIGAHWINPIPFGVRRSFVDSVLEAGLQFVPAGTEDDRRQLRFGRWGAYALSTFRPARLRHLLQRVTGQTAT